MKLHNLDADSVARIKRANQLRIENTMTRLATARRDDEMTRQAKPPIFKSFSLQSLNRVECQDKMKG